MQVEPGKYKLLRRIAVGGMAEIFLATIHGEAGFERKIIIKKILPSYAGDVEFAHRLIDEGLLASRLTHANIVQVLDLGKLGPDYFIAMEFVDGPDLRDILQHSREREFSIPVPIATHLLWEISRALGYAHQKMDSKGEPYGIVHRDISPANVLLSWEGAVKLTDFGIAKARYRLVNTMAGVLQGKFPYMSPEQAEGNDLDQRSDIFSFGSLAYELLTLIRPFQAKSDLGTLERIRTGNFKNIQEIRPEIPPELAEIVERCLSLKRDDRYANGHELERALALVMQRNGWVVGEADVIDLLSILYGDQRRSVTEGIESVPEEEIEILDARPIDPADVSGYGTNPPVFPQMPETSRTRSVRVDTWHTRRRSRNWLWGAWFGLLGVLLMLVVGDYFIWNRVLGGAAPDHAAVTDVVSDSREVQTSERSFSPRLEDLVPADTTVEDIVEVTPGPDMGDSSRSSSEPDVVMIRQDTRQPDLLKDLETGNPELDVQSESKQTEVVTVAEVLTDTVDARPKTEEKARPTATRLTTVPRDVNVLINGEVIDTTPTLIRLQPGMKRSITLSKPGYESVSFVLDYPGPRKVYKRLEQIQTGRLQLRYLPAAAEVTIDGRPFSGKNGMNIIETELPTGTHQIEVRSGGKTKTRTITIEKGRQWRGTITVEP